MEYIVGTFSSIMGTYQMEIENESNQSFEFEIQNDSYK